MCFRAILALWNGRLMDLSRSYKIECVKNINTLVLNAILASCHEDSRHYWSELFEVLEKLLVKIIESNSEGCRHLQIKVDRDLLSFVNEINAIQLKEEKHVLYLERRKHRKPTYSVGHNKHKKKHSHRESDTSSCSSSDEESHH